ncbi:DNA recombination protein RmuC [Spongiibacter sp. KMU-158]|uniref:DNA recombination protein RmuC n=1 Tax=Spongiibacter pelagi TaxID=2760804 RepID=A0A927C303_9GAMM|nr:DNA recombination protein RmuC [Spongiibacter pelagi]MBD2859208.1 DNA recombination protein RmuC [Spongiibacter pelagi]
MPAALSPEALIALAIACAVLGLPLLFLVWRLLAAKAQLQRAREKQQALETEQAVYLERYNHLQAANQQHQKQLEQASEELDSRNRQIAQQQSDISHLRSTADEKIALLTETRKQLTEQFESLAGKIFEEKQRSFQERSTASLESSLKPFKEQLQEFRQRVDMIHSKDNEQHGELRQQLLNLQKMNDTISQDAQNLTKALKGDNKKQGNWGEVILERVLEESGLRKDHEYQTQQSFTDETGRRRQPDVVVHLPDGKDIVIDAKVSLIAYERYCSAEDDAEKQQALREHIQSLKSHISGLSNKAYEHIEGLRTLDFVFIFIPIESAYMVAFEKDAEMFRNAYEQNIVVVGPTTLLATLRTVQSIWRHERQNQNAEKIARQAGALHDQFALVLESFQDLGKHMDRSKEAYEKSLDRLSRGRGNLIGRVAKLEALGAKVKKTLPAELLEQADEIDDDNTEDNQEN